MVFAANEFLVAAVCIGPSILTALYANALNKRLKKIVYISDTEKLEFIRANASITQLVEDLSTQVDAIESDLEEKRISSLIQGKSEPTRKARKSSLMSNVVQGSNIAPKAAGPKNAVYYMGAKPESKKKARKQSSK